MLLRRKLHVSLVACCMLHEFFFEASLTVHTMTVATAWMLLYVHSMIGINNNWTTIHMMISVKVVVQVEQEVSH
jgi:hypothetical protein